MLSQTSCSHRLTLLQNESHACKATRQRNIIKRNHGGDGQSENPAAFEDLLGRWPFLGVLADHFLKKFLKLLQSKPLSIFQVLGLQVAFPKLFKLLLCNHLVELILFHCKFKGQCSHDQCEEDDSKGKDIAFVRLIGSVLGVLAVMYLRGHIPLPSPLVLVKGDPLSLLLKPAGKAKVTDLHTDLPVLLADQHVLQLQIAMRDAQTVQVMNSIGEIPKEVPFVGEGEVLGGLDVVEEGAMFSVFQDHDVLRVELFILCITQRHPLLVPQRPDDMLVLQLPQEAVLVTQVQLLSPRHRRNRLQHHAGRTGTVGKQRRPAPTCDQRQLVLGNVHRRGQEYQLLFLKVRRRQSSYVFKNG